MQLGKLLLKLLDLLLRFKDFKLFTFLWVNKHLNRLWTLWLAFRVRQVVEKSIIVWKSDVNLTVLSLRWRAIRLWEVDMLTLSEVCKYLKMELHITQSLFQVPNKSLIGFSLSRIIHLIDARSYDFAKFVPHFFIFWWFGTRCAFKLTYLWDKTLARSDFLQELPSA